MEESYRYILDCDMLIIDDLGTELNNSFVSSQLFYCINERIGRKKGTIISTNLSMGMLKDTYSDRVTSALRSGYPHEKTGGKIVKNISSLIKAGIGLT